MKHIKKYLSLFLVLALALSFFSCASAKEEAIEFLANKIKNADNYEMTLAFEDIPVLGSYTVTYKRDGDKTFLSDSLIGTEQYTEKTENGVTVYTKTALGVTKSELSSQEIDGILSSADFETLFNGKNYTETAEDNLFRMKDGISLEGLSNVSLKIIGGGCVISAEITYGGITADASITVKNIGSTAITLPEA